MYCFLQVKQLFTRESKKNKKDKKNNQEMVTEEVLRSRYTEYKGGSRDNLLNNSKYVNKRHEQIDSDTVSN